LILTVLVVFFVFSTQFLFSEEELFSSGKIDWKMSILVAAGLILLVLLIILIRGLVRKNNEMNFSNYGRSQSEDEKNRSEDDDEADQEDNEDEENETDEEDKPLKWENYKKNLEESKYYAYYGEDQLSMKELDLFLDNGWELISADHSNYDYHFKKINGLKKDDELWPAP
jgi:hypothetical protein